MSLVLGLLVCMGVHVRLCVCLIVCLLVSLFVVFLCAGRCVCSCAGLGTFVHAFFLCACVLRLLG